MKKTMQKYVPLPDLIAPLQLDRYLVDDLLFKCNAMVAKEGQKQDDASISVDFDVKGTTTDKNLFLLDMKVDLNEGRSINEFDKYQIHLHLYGWFRFTSDLDDQTKTRMLYTNASSMLYGVARSVVGNLTGSFGTERYTLPVLNLLTVAKAKSERGNKKNKLASSAGKP